MDKVYIIAAKRTAIGSFLGTLAPIHPSDLGAQLVRHMVDTLTKESNISVSDINEVIVGNVLPAGQGQGLARQVAIKANIPIEIPAYGINMVCGSGMKAVMNGYMSIKAGINQLVLTGGVESMSNVPFITPGSIRRGNKLGNISLEDGILMDGLTDVFNHYHMGITAENIATQYHISREEQDAFAFVSQQRAIQAIDCGRFKDEIVPIHIVSRNDTLVFDTDEYPNRTTTPEKLAKLKTVFKSEGTVTAGNSSGINDGASMTFLASESFVKEHQLTPLAEIIGIGQGGVDPSVMGLGPVPAIKDVLKNANLAFEHIDLIELNEAFAAQSLGVIKELSSVYGVSEQALLKKTNVNGGAIALGHPVGVSGNRILVTLIHEMKKQQLAYGLASLCIGGGMGTAVIIKNV